MNCKDFNEMISLYIDNELSNLEKKEFDLHLLQCEECRKSYEQMIEILKLAKDHQEEELPKNYRANLREKLEQTKKQEKKKFNWKTYSAIAAGILIFVSSIAIISNTYKLEGLKNEEGQSYEISEMNEKNTTSEVERGMPEMKSIAPIEADGYYGLEDAESTEYNGFSEVVRKNKLSMSIKEQERKIIKDAFLEIDVEDYDNIFNKIIAHVEDNGGYIERSETGTRVFRRAEKESSLKQGYLLLRVPSEKMSNSLKYLKELGIVKDERKAGENITDSYFDVENTVRNLQIQEERLRDILKKADKVQEILQIENELRRIRTEIDRNMGQLKSWDSMVAMSKIEISLNEVERLDNVIKPVDENMWYKAKKGLIATINNIVDTLENLFIKFISVLPILTIIIVILIIIYIFIRKYMVKEREEDNNVG